MPLPLSAERELLHIRKIDLRGYRRTDGLYDIEGRVTDTKEHPFRRPATDEDVPPGTPLHDMWIRLVVDEDLVIHDIVAVTDASPHAVCPEATATLKQIKGARIGAGWTRFVKERLGGRRSCTHLMELLMPTRHGRVPDAESDTSCQAGRAWTNRPAAQDRQLLRLRERQPGRAKALAAVPRQTQSPAGCRQRLIRLRVHPRGATRTSGRRMAIQETKAGPIPILGLAHIGIRVHDLERSMRFYELSASRSPPVRLVRSPWRFSITLGC